MSQIISVEQAALRLGELVHGLRPGDEIVLTEAQRPVARLLPSAGTDRGPRRPGSACGKLVIRGEDDTHLDDFAEYM
jgi:antitoxin (DNA-binding transcriptional repressor) of toxin-antitoxin stability system